MTAGAQRRERGLSFSACSAEYAPAHSPAAGAGACAWTVEAPPERSPDWRAVKAAIKIPAHKALRLSMQTFRNPATVAALKGKSPERTAEKGEAAVKPAQIT